MQIRYILLAILVSLLVWFALVWFRNYQFLIKYFSLTTVLGTWASFRQSFSPISQASIIVLSLLFGTYVSLLTYYFRKRYLINRAAGLGVVGTFLAILGIGCGVCGSVALSTVVGLSASAAILSILPFKGQEFSAAGILILLLVIFLLVRELRKPIVCPKK